jgi:hypothetical protein
MTDVFKLYSLMLAFTQRRPLLGPLQSLNAGFLVHTDQITFGLDACKGLDNEPANQRYSYQEG